MKCTTIRAKTPMSDGTTYRIHLGLRWAPERVIHRYYDFVIGEHSGRLGVQNPTDAPDVDREYWVERVLEAGDEFFFEAEMDEALKAQSPPNTSIGAFWQVREDGSIICTGT